jgi:hypothetical protein
MKMMMEFKFGTAINCIDGRTQEVVIDHIKRNYGVDAVDLVTFPGVDGILSYSSSSSSSKDGGQQRSEDIIASIRNAVSISIEKHGSNVIAVVGHHDCAGNPGDKEHHYEDIRNAMHKVSSWNFPGRVVGFYVNDKREMEEVR